MSGCQTMLACVLVILFSSVPGSALDTSGYSSPVESPNSLDKAYWVRRAAEVNTSWCERVCGGCVSVLVNGCVCVYLSSSL